MKILFLMILLFALNSCSLIDPATRAQDLLRSGKYEDAIKVLEKEYKIHPGSVPMQSLLAQTYSNYGIAITRDQSLPPKVKYPKAKEQLSMALALNPYLEDAKEMYDLIEKIQAQFAANMIQ